MNERTRTTDDDGLDELQVNVSICEHFSSDAYYILLFG